MRRRGRMQAAVEPENAPEYFQWWLLLALFFEYARPTGFVPGLAAIPLNSLIPLTLVLACTFAKGLRSKAEIFADPLTKWVLIYFGLITFSIVHADVTLYAFTISKTVLGYVLIFFTIVRIATTQERIHGVFATLIIAHLFLLAMNPEAVMNPEERHYIKGGTFLGDGNDFSLSVCIILPMAIELALTARSKLLKIFWWLALLILVLAVIGSSSRGGTLGMAAVAGYLWLKSPKKVLSLALIGVAVVILLAYAPELYFQRMSTLANYQDDGSAMSRIDAWKSGFRMLIDNPIFGVAAGHFASAYGTDYRPAAALSAKWMNAHSMYFMILGELALPGIITYLTLLIGNMRLNTRLRHALEAAKDKAGKTGKTGRAGKAVASTLALGDGRLLYLLNAGMVGFMVAGAFLSVAYYPHIFVLTALMISARRILRQKAGLPEYAKPAPRGRRAKAPAVSAPANANVSQAPAAE